MGKHISTGQIRELLDIDRARGGIGPEFQELISRLTSGGVGVKNDDPRAVQAKVLWDKGFGRESRCRCRSFQDYLATIPEIPPELVDDDPRFPLLVLVDDRPLFSRACELVGLRDEIGNVMDDSFDRERIRVGTRWMRCQDGRKHRGRFLGASRKSFAPDEVGLDVVEGVALYAQHPELINGHFIYLANSVRFDAREIPAFLGPWLDRPSIGWSFDFGGPLGHYGVASRKV